MEKLTIQLTLERATKNTYRYQEVEDKGGMPAVIGALYLQKWAVGDKAPEKITVEVTS